MPAAVIGLALWAGILLAFHATSGWVPLLDSANLAFHEAGHPLFGMLFGDNIMVYGGTLMQLLMPTAAWFEMRRQEKFVGAGFCAIWLGESLLNVARYMADARAHQLPLVGGLDPEYAHDWTYIFNNWDALQSDTTVAAATRVLAVALMGYALYAVWRDTRDAT